MTDTTIRRPLTETEVASIHEGIDAADTPTDALMAALTLTFNALLSDNGETFEDYSAERPLDGMRLLIPNSQWCQIGEWLNERAGALAQSDIGRVNLALSWMNSGPSGYETTTTEGAHA